MADDIGQIHRMVGDDLAQIGPTVEENFQKEWDEHGRWINGTNWKKFRHTEEGRRRLLGWAQGRTFSPLYGIRDAIRLADHLGVSLELPHIDFSELDKFEGVTKADGSS